jgi:hypothetical protein
MDRPAIGHSLWGKSLVNRFFPFEFRLEMFQAPNVLHINIAYPESIAW